MSEHVTLECAQGRLTGTRENGIARFAGIPFAKPPTGPRRWRMPEPAAPWAGTRDATGFGTVCPQVPSQLERMMGMTIGEQAENCLFLNVWTPGWAGPKKPVMVWIHGGAFMIGAGSQSIYDGTALAARDCVIVTINYRLGALGFVSLREASKGALPATGCEGLADQILALDWVRRNIDAFGGDPGNVTVFGESAGGMSIGGLLAARAGRGLFHKAIAQSGAAHIGHSAERAARAGRAFLAALGLHPDEAHKALDLPYGAIIGAQIAVQAEAREGRNPHRLGPLPFQPSVDGQILEGEPIAAIRAGGAAGIPLLTGTTLEEWKLFTAANPATRLMSAKSFAERVEKLGGEDAPALLAAYDSGSTFERFNRFMTDKVFAQPCVRLLEAQENHAPTYAYRFDWRSKLLGGVMGACHAAELGFLFGSYRDKWASAFFGKGPEADSLSDTIMTAWTNFARTGAPDGEAWPRYDSDARRTMILGDGAPHLAHDPERARRLAWTAIPDRRLGP